MLYRLGITDFKLLCMKKGSKKWKEVDTDYFGPLSPLFLTENRDQSLSPGSPIGRDSSDESIDGIEYKDGSDESRDSVFTIVNSKRKKNARSGDSPTDKAKKTESPSTQSTNIPVLALNNSFSILKEISNSEK